LDIRFIKVGKIVNTFGLKGELKVYLFTDFPEKRFEKGSQLLIGSLEKPDQMSVEIVSSRPYKKMYVIRLKGYDHINEVESFKNLFLWIRKEQLDALEEGEYYYHQIIGCQVVTTTGERIGEVKEILSPGANDVWVVKPVNGKKDILLPYIEEIVKAVDLKKKTITIQLMEGLIDEV